MAPMRFEADLELTSDGRTIAITNDDDTLVVTTDDWRRDLSLLRRTGGLPLAGLGRAARQLEQAGATVRFDSAQGTLLTVGNGVVPSGAIRALGSPPLKFGRWRAYGGDPWRRRTKAIVALVVVLAAAGAGRASR